MYACRHTRTYLYYYHTPQDPPIHTLHPHPHTHTHTLTHTTHAHPPHSLPPPRRTRGRYVGYYAPLWVCIIVTFCCYMSILRRIQAMGVHGGADAGGSLARIKGKMLLVPVAFLILRLPETIFRFIELGIYVQAGGGANAALGQNTFNGNGLGQVRGRKRAAEEVSCGWRCRVRRGEETRLCVCVCVCVCEWLGGGRHC